MAECLSIQQNQAIRNYDNFRPEAVVVQPSNSRCYENAHEIKNIMLWKIAITYMSINRVRTYIHREIHRVDNTTKRSPPAELRSAGVPRQYCRGTSHVSVFANINQRGLSYSI